MEETGCAGLEAADHPRCVIHIRSHLYCAVCAGLAVSDWISMEHFRAVFQDAGLMGVYKNSLYVALLTAVFGTLAHMEVH